MSGHGGGEKAPIGIVIDAMLECVNPFAWAIFAGSTSSSH